MSHMKMTEPTVVVFGMWTCGTQNNVLSGGLKPLRRRDNFFVGEDISSSIVKHREYLACRSCSQRYSVDGSSDVASCCQYCSSLFVLQGLKCCASPT